MARKQHDLPEMKGAGVEAQPEIPAIEKSAEEYTVLRDRRMKELEGEIVAKGKLIALMHDHKLNRIEL